MSKVLVVAARGLQAGMLGAYGNMWIDTPALDALAAEGVVADQHFADAADPAGARRAWRSGLYRLPPLTPPPTDEPDLIAHLRGQGIHTCLVVDGSRPAPPEFALGWDEAIVVPPSAGTPPLERTLIAATEALERLVERDGWLLWLDLATPLPPWDAPEAFQAPYFRDEAPEEETDEDEDEEDEEIAEEEEPPLTPLTHPVTGEIDAEDDLLYLRMQSSYAAAVSYLDAGVGQLLEALRAGGLLDEVAVVFTSDQGQAIGERGVVGDVRPWPHEEIVHVPLIVRLPQAEQAGRRLESLTQHVDLAPTLAHLLGTPLPATHGNSLLPLLRGETDLLRPYAVAGREVGGAIEWVLRTPEWAFLLPGDGSPRTPQLYVKPDDRWEVNNVLHHHDELAAGLERTLRGFVEATRRAGALQAPELPKESEPEHGEAG
jgi:arylsulfatase A-like enzyme